MALATIKVYVDWDNNGNFTGTYDEITNDVENISIRRGRDSELGVASLGTLELRVSDPNRKYSPENSTGVLYGKLLPRRVIKVEATLGITTTSLFYGYLENLICHPKHDEQETYLYAVDGLDFLSRAEIKSTLYKNQLTGTLIGHILDDADWSAALRDIDAGQLTVPLASWDNATAWSAIGDLQSSEFVSFAYIDGRGYLCWEDGAHREDAALAATFDDDYFGIGYEYGAKDIYNEIRVTYKKFELQPLAEIWRLEEIPSIEAGLAGTYWASFTDFADSITTPVATTDYTANTAANGSGTDKTAQIAITTTKFAQGAKLVVTNNDAGTIYITLLRLRGELYDTKSSITVKNEDAISQAAYQKRVLSFETKFLTDATIAQTYASNALAKYKNPGANITLSLIATPDSSADVIERKISDEIRVKNARLGMDKYFFIEQVNYTFSEGSKKQEVTWVLSETDYAVEQQTEYTENYGTITYGPGREGQRLTIPNRTITKLAFYICKRGAPTGTVTFTIRKVSDDSIIASKLWGNAADLPLLIDTWEKVTFDTPVLVNEEVRILFETTAGDISNCVLSRRTATDVKAGEQYSYKPSGGGAYVDYAGDFMYKYYYKL